MRIGRTENFRVGAKVSFGRALTESEQSEYIEVLKDARKAVINNLTANKPDADAGKAITNYGKSILIVHDTCLPQAAATDTGIGHLTSETSGKFFDFVKNQLGINTIEVLPQGELAKKSSGQFRNPYGGSSLSLGSHQIDLELLTKPEFNSILSKEDFESVVNENLRTAKAGETNLENVSGRASSQECALKKAYDNFMGNSKIDKTAFNQYKAENADWLEKKALYSILKKENEGKNWQEWASEIDRNLFDEPTEAASKRIAELKKAYETEIDRYMFKQYLADEHLKLGRHEVNKRNMKLIGDCPIGFSPDEVWGNKKAFELNTFVGEPEWKLPALNYSEISKPESAAQKLLRRKVELYAKRYDGVRIDCSWSYVEPKLSTGEKYNFGGKLLDIIDETVKKVKGDKFDPSNIIHEFEADPKDFSIFDKAKRIKPFLHDRVKIISSAYLDKDYGSFHLLSEREVNPESYILGVGNHDPQPLKEIAQNIPDEVKGKLVYRRNAQTQVLADIMNLRPEEIRTPAQFSQIKFAEPMQGRNQMFFYRDVFGIEGKFNYRQRIPIDYEKQYQAAVQNGFGYNPMDAYTRVFKVQKLDEAQPALFRKIVKFRDILSEQTEIAARKVKKSVNNIAKNKWFNIGGVVVGVGILATVIASTKKKLDKRN